MDTDKEDPLPGHGWNPISQYEPVRFSVVFYVGNIVVWDTMRPKIYKFIFESDFYTLDIIIIFGF